MLFVAKVFRYPWERATSKDESYAAISGDAMSN